MLHLLFSINRWELKDTIINKLKEECHLILDRYSYSGIAYSNAKGVDLNYCVSPEKGLPKPDLVIYLQAKNVRDLLNREGYGDEVYEKESFQKKVKQVYETKLIKKDWVIIDACQSIEEISDQINEVISRHIKNDTKEIDYFN